jgi:hypothetical protein
MNEIKEARDIRARLASSVKFIMSDEEAINEAGHRLEWEDLEGLPDWYMWDESKIKHLVLVAGTVFLLPTIRLWIEAKKIKQIQMLISKPVFEYIMQYTHVDHMQRQAIDMDDMSSVLEEAGASVVLSSQEKRLHPWLEPKLPKSKGRLKKKVATELMNHTVFVIEQMQNINKIVHENDQTLAVSQGQGNEMS